MHRRFRELLSQSKGVSEFVVVVFADVRGFSAFSKSVESPEAAVFIKRVYSKLIDEYFPFAKFFKPAGDGLLLVADYDEGSLPAVCTKVVEACFKVGLDFPNWGKGDSMINFETPKKIGFGIARGTACRLEADGVILDYSGKLLNLASRLNDLARPEGIVIDGSFGLNLLPAELQAKFERDDVFIRSVAEDRPMQVLYSKGLTLLSPQSKQPILEAKWHHEASKRTLAEISDMGPKFIQPLKVKPKDPLKINVKIQHPALKKDKTTPLTGFESTFAFAAFRYIVEAGIPKIELNMEELEKKLVEAGVKPDMSVAIDIYYPE